MSTFHARSRRKGIRVQDTASAVISLIIYSVVIIVNIIIIAGNIKHNNFIANAESCYATVDYIDVYTTTSTSGTGRHRHRTTKTHYDAYCHYTVNSITYQNAKISTNSSTKAGDQLLIYYDPKNPSVYSVANSDAENILTYIICGAFILVFTIISIYTIRVLIIRSREKRLNAVTPYTFTNNSQYNNTSISSLNSNPTDNNNPYNSYTGYYDSQNNPYSDDSFQNNYQNNSFNSYSDNSFQNNSFNSYSDNSFQNNYQNNSFNSYSDNSFQNNSFNSYSDDSLQSNNPNNNQNTSDRISPFDKYK